MMSKLGLATLMTDHSFSTRDWTASVLLARFRRHPPLARRVDRFCTLGKGPGYLIKLINFPLIKYAKSTD